MAKKTVISKVLDAEAVDGIIEFPQNKTLYIDQFTDMAPVRPGEVFQPETMSLNAINPKNVTYRCSIWKAVL